MRLAARETEAVRGFAVTRQREAEGGEGSLLTLSASHESLLMLHVLSSHRLFAKGIQKSDRRSLRKKSSPLGKQSRGDENP